ncbi:MAG: alpha/beta fold hydrolase [Gammaproteobacteria bacterium]|nr:alpha/beta fold hydrolase [Gammaproteobacteria bacterium]
MNAGRGYVPVSFGQMHYRFAGTTNKPVVVLLHQTPSNSAMFEQLMQLLATDFRLLAPDIPGMGMSDPLPGDSSITDFADAMLEFFDELGLDACCLFGHHTGASIAAEIAAIRPRIVTAIAMSGPTLLTEEQKLSLPAAAQTFPLSENGEHVQRMWQRMRNKDGELPLELALRETLFGLQLGERYSQAYAAVIAQDFATSLKACEAPALLFAGTGDPMFEQLDAAAGLMGNAITRTIDGAKTYVCETHSAEVADLLRNFFPREAAQ